MNQRTLAIDGGAPLFGPTHFERSFQAPIADALQAALDQQQWYRYHGTCSERLRELLCETFVKRHAILCCSGTIAVELALRGAGVRPGDEVILAGYDFPGNFRSIEAIGATPVLVDVVADGWTLDPELVAEAVSEKTRAVVASHLHGQIADIPAIRKQLRTTEHGDSIQIIEDACQVPGASLNDRPLGSLGDVSTLSFGGSKLLTAGRGGAVLCDEDQVRQRIAVFSERGNDAFPLSELQAAVLIPQIESVTSFAEQRWQKMQTLLTQLSAAGIAVNDGSKSTDTMQSLPAFYKLPLKLPSSAQVSREECLATITAEGVPIGAGFRGFVKRSSRRCRKPTELTHSRDAAERTMLLHHTILDAPIESQRQLADLIGNIFN